MSDKTTTREKALIWWGTLPFNSNNTEKGKVNYTFKYYGLDRKYTSLTGKEIEEIYLKEITSNPSTDVLENTPFHKPDFSHLKPKEIPNLATELKQYINDKHTQEECIGFIDGFEKAYEIENNLINKSGFSHLKVQTAVDWLIKELTGIDRNLINKKYLHLNNSLAGIKLKEIFEKAKAIEQQHLEHSFDVGVSSVLKNFDKAYSDVDGETYYKSRFKQ
jgi:hypothetical protein